MDAPRIVIGLAAPGTDTLAIKLLLGATGEGVKCSPVSLSVCGRHLANVVRVEAGAVVLGRPQPPGRKLPLPVDTRQVELSGIGSEGPGAGT